MRIELLQAYLIGTLDRRILADYLEELDEELFNPEVRYLRYWEKVELKKYNSKCVFKVLPETKALWPKLNLVTWILEKWFKVPMDCRPESGRIVSERPINVI